MTRTEASIWLSHRGPGDAERVGFWAEYAAEAGLASPIVLLSADQLGVMAITRSVGMCKVTASCWQELYLVKGIIGLRRATARNRRASRR
jgi:hypothetical protein